MNLSEEILKALYISGQAKHGWKGDVAIFEGREGYEMGWWPHLTMAGKPNQKWASPKKYVMLTKQRRL